MQEQNARAFLELLVAQIKAYSSSDFSGLKWAELMRTVRVVERLLKEPVS